MHSIIRIVLTIIGSSVAAAAVTSAFWSYKNLKIVDNLSYKWALEDAYNDGKHNERLCVIFGKDKSPMQKEFCNRHDDYQNHPKHPTKM